MNKAHDSIERADKDKVVRSWREPDSNILYIDQLTNQAKIIDEATPLKASSINMPSLIPKRFYFQIDGEQRYLTKREVECAVQLLQGKSNDDISRSLFVSSRTVETHMESLLAKTNLSNRNLLVDFLFKNGLFRFRLD